MAVAHALFAFIVEEREGLWGLEIFYNNTPSSCAHTANTFP